MARDETLRERLKPTSTGAPVSVEGIAGRLTTPAEIARHNAALLISKGRIDELSDYVRQYDELQGNYRDHIVARAEIALEELKKARRKGSIVVYDPAETHVFVDRKAADAYRTPLYTVGEVKVVQDELKALIEKYSPSQRSNGNCHSEPKRSCLKACNGF